MGDVLLCPNKVEDEAILLILGGLPRLPIGGAPLVRHVTILLLVTSRRYGQWREGSGGGSGGEVEVARGGGRHVLQSASISWRNTGRLPTGRSRLKPLQNRSKRSDWSAARC